MTDYRDEDIPKLFKIVLVHPEREEEIKQAMIPLIPNLQEARSKFGRHSRQFDDMWRLWLMMLGYRIYNEEHAQGPARTVRGGHPERWQGDAGTGAAGHDVRHLGRSCPHRSNSQIREGRRGHGYKA